MKERIEALVARARGDDRALDEGRVFIGRKRARRGDLVERAEEVVIHPRGAERSADVTILLRDRGIVAVDKPAGISTIPDQRDAEGSLLHRVARAVGVEPGALHPTSRLDRGVSGVVLFAENARARERLKAAREAGAYHRRYIALCAKPPEADRGAWEAPIGKARDPKKRAAFGPDAAAAKTRYAVVSRGERISVLSVEPETGRTHQIRVHASHAGCPLLGDRDYGGARTAVLPSGKVLSLDRVGLHCAEVRVLGLAMVAPVPEELVLWWLQLEPAPAMG